MTTDTAIWNSLDKIDKKNQLAPHMFDFVI